MKIGRSENAKRRGGRNHSVKGVVAGKPALGVEEALPILWLTDVRRGKKR